MIVECQIGELDHKFIYISNDGSQIYNLSSGKWLHPYIKHGYYYVDLKKDGKFRPYAVHRLVARIHCWRNYLFCDVGVPWEMLCVHHRNGNKLDNRPENLEIISPGSHAGIHHGNRELLIFVPDGTAIEPGIRSIVINGEKTLIFIPEDQEKVKAVITIGGAAN